MNIKEISKISDLIIWNHKDLENNFTNKEIISFFVESGIDRSEIISFVWDLKTPKRWLPTFLKDLYDNWELIETLTNISDNISFYNPEFKKLIWVYTWDKKDSKKIKNNKVAIFMKYDNDRKVIYDEIIEPICKELNLIPTRADLETKEWENIHNTINNMLDESWYYIVDISGWSANTFIELWYLLWKKEKVIVLKQDWEPRPFNINDIKMTWYKKWTMDNDKNTENKETLKKELKNAIEEKISELI